MSCAPADVRGPDSGAGRLLLTALEAQAAAVGYREVRLSTRRVNAGALAFYRRNGYAAVDNDGRYARREASVCLGKQLPCVDSTAS